MQPAAIDGWGWIDFIIHMLISGVLKVDEVFLTIDPDFFMYEVYNQLHGSRFKQYELPSDGETLGLKADDILAYANLVGAKMIMFSNPNNPSSVAFDEKRSRNSYAILMA